MHDFVHSKPSNVLYNAFCPCSKDKDVFKNYQSIMAKRFKTPAKRFSRFLLVFLLCCVASGPLNSWPTIEPLLGELHVLGSTYNHSSTGLNQVQTLGFSFGSLLSIPLGVAYDVLGPGTTAAGGAVSAAIGTLSMAFAISNTKYNWILYFAYPLATIGGSMNSMAILGWQWLMPERQSLINSLYGASLAISDTLAIVGVMLVNRNILTLQTFFILIGVVAVLAAIICYLVTPSKMENSMHYMIVLHENMKEEYEKTNFNSIDVATPKINRRNIQQAQLENNNNNNNINQTLLEQGNNQYDDDIESHEVIENKEDVLKIKNKVNQMEKDSNFKMACKQIWKATKGSVKVLIKFPLPLFLAQCFVCMIYWSSFYPMSSMYNYYVLSLGVEDAVSLVDAFSVIYGITGSVCTLFAGWLCDQVGLVRFLRYTNMLLVITAILQMIPRYEIQLLWITMWTMSFNLFMIIYLRLTMHYAPMEIFGAFQGILGTFMVFPQLIGSGLVRKYFTNAFPNSPKQFYYPYVILNSITILFGIILNIYWWKYPPPAVGTVIFGENGEIYKSKEEMDADLSSKPLIDRSNDASNNIHYDVDEIRGSDNEDYDVDNTMEVVKETETFF